MASRILLLAAALAILCSVANAQYTFTPGNANFEPIWKCDNTKTAQISDKVVTPGQPSPRERCEGFCARVNKTIVDLEESDQEPSKKNKEMADKCIAQGNNGKKCWDDYEKNKNVLKRCNETAKALWQLLDAVELGDTATVTKLIKVIHNGTCLEALLKDWSARDAACIPSFFDPQILSQLEGFKEAGKRVAWRRLFSVLVQFYNTIQPDFDILDTNKDGDVAIATEALEAQKPLFDSIDKNQNGLLSPEEWEYAFGRAWCVIDAMNFRDTGTSKGILFEENACDNMNPIWNTMASCKPGCWKNSIFPKVKKGGCIALYQSLISGMFLENTKLMTNNVATEFALEFPSSKDDRLEGASDAEKQPLKLPDYAWKKDAISPDCIQKKTVPCTSIDRAISLCAAADGESDALWKYQSKIQTQDSYGAVSKGGVKCKQGPSCSH